MHKFAISGFSRALIMQAMENRYNLLAEQHTKLSNEKENLIKENSSLREVRFGTHKFVVKALKSEAT